jgi:hypothetical protein
LCAPTSARMPQCQSNLFPPVPGLLHSPPPLLWRGWRLGLRCCLVGCGYRSRHRQQSPAAPPSGTREFAAACGWVMTTPCCWGRSWFVKSSLAPLLSKMVGSQFTREFLFPWSPRPQRAPGMSQTSGLALSEFVPRALGVTSICNCLWGNPGPPESSWWWTINGWSCRPFF